MSREVYALLLDHLGIDRAAVLAYSAGSASALELALRRPGRVLGLVLANARLGGPTQQAAQAHPEHGVRLGAPVWLYRALLPSLYARMVGIPKGYQPIPEDLATIRAVSELQFPLRPRSVAQSSTVRVQPGRRPVPFEELTVPTLIVSATDDPWARHHYAAAAAGRIPGAKLVTIDRGGPLFLSHDAQVRTATGGFLEPVAQPERRPTWAVASHTWTS